MWSPLTGRWWDFSEVRVHIRAHGTLTADVLLPGPDVDGVPPSGSTGRRPAPDGLLLTAVTRWGRDTRACPERRDGSRAAPQALLGASGWT